MNPSEFSRRQLLLKTLFGAGMIGLRSLATGIPAAILLNPREALARSHRSPRRPAAVAAPQFIILATSGDGDPLGANAPGSYVNPLVGHPSDPQMAPRTVTLSGQPFTAAKPWSTLPQALLDRSCFFHHTTNTLIHADEAKVLGLGGAIAGEEMFASLLASKLAPALGTVQADPIVLGPRQTSEDLVYQGRPEPILSPASLATLLSKPSGALGRLTQLRDADLDRLNAIVKNEGNVAKSDFIDRYALSQRQARQVSEDLLSELARISDNGPASQITAAVTLIRMNVAPVVSVHIPFGGDNHYDPWLTAETTETVASMALLNGLWSQLVAANLQDRVSFLSLNVFGRTLRADHTHDGRHHNGDHHVALMFGPGFRGGVIGGIEEVGEDMGAMSLDSATGAGVAAGGGDVSRKDSLLAMATTFGRGAGVDAAVLAEGIPGGTAIEAALVAPS